jgi:diaminopimelate decarboxylase
MPRLEAGDLLVVGLAGAYASARLSRFNGRPAPAEVMVKDGEVHLMRERETVDALWRGHTVPDWARLPL